MLLLKYADSELSLLNTIYLKIFLTEHIIIYKNWVNTSEKITLEPLYHLRYSQCIFSSYTTHLLLSYFLPFSVCFDASFVIICI